jgi:hypothetical protein
MSEKIILFVDDDDFFHRGFLDGFETVCMARGLDFEAVKLRVQHAYDMNGAREIMAKYGADIVMVVADNQLSEGKMGVAILKQAKISAPDADLIWASSDSPGKEERKELADAGIHYQIVRKDNFPKIKDHIRSSDDFNKEMARDPDASFLIEPLRVLSTALKKMEIASSTTAVEMARRTGQEQMDKANRPVGR